MTHREFIQDVREKFKNDLPTLLNNYGLKPLTMLDSSLSLESTDYSFCVIPSTIGGSTLTQEDDGSLTSYFCVWLNVGENADEESLKESELYYSAFIDFILLNTFGSYSTLQNAYLFRMDEGEPHNGALYLVKSNLGTTNDYNWIGEK